MRSTDVACSEDGTKEAVLACWTCGAVLFSSAGAVHNALHPGEHRGRGGIKMPQLREAGFARKTVRASRTHGLILAMAMLQAQDVADFMREPLDLLPDN